MGVLAVMENHDHEKLKYHLKVNELMCHDKGLGASGP